MVVDVEVDCRVARTEAKDILVVADKQVAAVAEVAARAATIALEILAQHNSIKTVSVEHIPLASKASTGLADFITINCDINVHRLQEQT